MKQKGENCSRLGNLKSMFEAKTNKKSIVENEGELHTKRFDSFMKLTRTELLPTLVCIGNLYNFLDTLSTLLIFFIITRRHPIHNILSGPLNIKSE